jgi:hypothetical protein
LTKTEIPGLLHWLIYVVDVGVSRNHLSIHLILKFSLQGVNSGWKVHAGTKGSTTFHYSKDEWRHVNDDTSVVTFVKIGKIDEGKNVDHLVEYVKDIPMDIVPESQKDSESKFSCRVFVKEAIRLLDKARVFVQCPDFNALAEEIKEQATAAESQDPKDQPLITTSKVARAWV